MKHFKVILLLIVLVLPLYAQQNAQAPANAGTETKGKDNASTITSRMGDIMPPILSTAVIKDIYANKAKLDVTLEWSRFDPAFMQEIEDNEKDIRQILQYVVDSRVYYYMRYNEVRLRTEMLDALNAYFKKGRVDNLRITWL
jgi:flagellar basal body-associated protein FliL